MSESDQDTGDDSVETTIEMSVQSSKAPRGPFLHRLLSSRKGLIILYLVFLGAYLAASGPRLKRHSPYNPFVYLAQGWLDGKLSLSVNPNQEGVRSRLSELPAQ